MCKYCNETFTGDANDDLVGLDVEVNGFRLFGIQTYITDSDGKVYIKTHLDEEHGRYVAIGSMEIHYCPVCGRKLSKES